VSKGSLGTFFFAYLCSVERHFGIVLWLTDTSDASQMLILGAVGLQIRLNEGPLLRVRVNLKFARRKETGIWNPQLTAAEFLLWQATIGRATNSSERGRIRGWTNRSPLEEDRRLWASWEIRITLFGLSTFWVVFYAWCI